MPRITLVRYTAKPDRAQENEALSRAVFKELERVRLLGYASDDEEYLTGVRATSAPVFDARGRLMAALLVVGLTGSLAVEDLVATGTATAATAQAISAALGAPPQD